MSILEEEFFKAIYADDLERLRRFHNKGIDIDTLLDKEKRTPLMVAISEKKKDIMNLILKWKPNIDIEDPHKETAIFYAIRCFNFYMIKKLHRMGANINHLNKHNMSLLNYAIYHNQLEIVKYLIENKIDIGNINHIGQNILDFYNSFYKTNSNKNKSSYDTIGALLKDYIIDRYYTLLYSNQQEAKEFRSIFQEQDKIFENSLSNYLQNEAKPSERIPNEIIELLEKDLNLDEFIETIIKYNLSNEQIKKIKICILQSNTLVEKDSVINKLIQLIFDSNNDIKTKEIENVLELTDIKKDELHNSILSKPLSKKILTKFGKFLNIPNNDKLTLILDSLEKYKFKEADEMVKEFKIPISMYNIYKVPLVKAFINDSSIFTNLQKQMLIDGINYQNNDFLISLLELQPTNKQVKLLKDKGIIEDNDPLLKVYEFLLQYDFKSADDLLKNEEEIRKENLLNLKSIFVKKYLEELLNKESETKISLDKEQVKAISDMSNKVLVTARAGSGKTTTIVNKIIFEITKYGLKPNEIQALVFNREARGVLNERLKEYGKMARTFHSFAWHIYKKLTGKNPNVIDMDNEENKTTYLVNILEEEDGIDYREISYQSFRENKFLINGIYYGQLLMTNAQLPIINKYLADFLFEHQLYFNEIPLNFNLATAIGFNRRLNKPLDVDFQANIQNEGIKVYIRYDRESIKEDYQKYYKSKNDILIEFIQSFDSNVDRTNVEGLFKKCLEDHGIRVEKKEKKELLQKFYSKNKPNILSFLESLINRYQLLEWDVPTARKKIEEYTNRYQDDNNGTLKISINLYESYINKLSKNKALDFNMLLKEVINLLQALDVDDKTLSKKEILQKEEIQNLKLLFIDEFQDFNSLFSHIINAIVQINPKLRLFCVGDDWQSINAFAGADIKLFNNYKNNSSTHQIVTNHRSKDSIIECANTFMKTNNREGPIGIPEHKNNTKKLPQIFNLTYRYFQINTLKKISTKAISKDTLLYSETILRIIIDNLLKEDQSSNFSYLVISRKNELQEKVEHDFKSLYTTLSYRYELKKLFESINVEFTTAHKCKGKEADVVIILGESNSFPTYHRTSQTINNLFDANSLIEEQNVFYVALTRAKEELYFINPESVKIENKFVNQVLKMPLVLNRAYRSLANDFDYKTYKEDILKKTIDPSYDSSNIPLRLQQLWNEKKKTIKERSNFSDTEHEIKDITTNKDIEDFIQIDNLHTKGQYYSNLRCVEDSNTNFYYLYHYIPKKENELAHSQDFISSKLLDFKDITNIEASYYFLYKLKKILKNDFAIVTVPSSSVSKETPFASIIIPALTKYNHLIDASSCLVRTKDINPAHLQGTRSVLIHMNSIKLVHPELINGKNVLLIDDIKTTGNSLIACERILRENAKPKKIMKLTLGKTIYFK